MSLLRDRVALDEREFQARLREASPKMLPRVVSPSVVGPRSADWDETNDARPQAPIKNKLNDVLALYADGAHIKQIAAECEMFRRDVRRQIQQARLRGDPRAVRIVSAPRVGNEAFFVRLPAAAHRKIREAAESRALDEAEIVCRLVELIAADGLIDAVLDDQD